MGGTSLPSAAIKAACLGVCRGRWDLSSKHLSSFPWTASQKLQCKKLSFVPLASFTKPFIHSEIFFFFYIYYIPGPSSASKDAGMDQILTIRCLHIATPRPEVIWGYFLTSSFEFLMIGNYSLSSTLNFEPLLGLGITQGTGNRKMSKLHRLVPEKSHA